MKWLGQLAGSIQNGDFILSSTTVGIAKHFCSVILRLNFADNFAWNIREVLTIHVKISEGNSKLGKIRSVSLPSIKTCRQCACQYKCYAQKLERLRPSVRSAYQNNLDVLISDPITYWREVEAAIMMSRFSVSTFPVIFRIKHTSAKWSRLHQETSNARSCVSPNGMNS